MSNIYLTVTDNFYMSMSQDSKAQAGEDITVSWTMPEDIGYRIRLDYANGKYRTGDYVTGLTEYTIKEPANRRGFLRLQFTIDTETKGKQKTNELWIHVASSIIGDSSNDVILDELERLAFVEVQKDFDTGELVFYSLSGDEVGRVATDSDPAEIAGIINRLNALETQTASLEQGQAALTTRVENTENSIYTNQVAIADLRTELNTNTGAISDINDELTTIGSDVTANRESISDLETNYADLSDNVYRTDETYNKDEVDNKINAITFDTVWQSPVDTFADLATTYPDAVEGWTALVKDVGQIYTYNGTAWVQITSGSVTEIVTEENDGIVTSEMFKRWEDYANKIGEGAIDNNAMLLTSNVGVSPFSMSTTGGTTTIRLSAGTLIFVKNKETQTVVMQDSMQLEFVNNQLLVACPENIQEGLGVEDCFKFVSEPPQNDVEDDPKWYLIAHTFNQLYDYKQIYVNGYGNIHDTPAQQYNRATAYIIGMPATASITLNATTLSISAGSYQIMDSVTSRVVNVTLPTTRVEYQYGNVVYIDKDTNTVGATASAALPVNCYIIGNMNFLNGTARVYIYGIGEITTDGGGGSDEPRSRIVLNTISSPSFYFNSNAAFVISSGTAIFVDVVTGEMITKSLNSSTITYVDGSVLYMDQNGLNTIRIAPAATLPENVYIIGTMRSFIRYYNNLDSRYYTERTVEIFGYASFFEQPIVGQKVRLGHMLYSTELASIRLETVNDQVRLVIPAGTYLIMDYSVGGTIHATLTETTLNYTDGNVIAYGTTFQMISQYYPSNISPNSLVLGRFDTRIADDGTEIKSIVINGMAPIYLTEETE